MTDIEKFEEKIIQLKDLTESVSKLFHNMELDDCEFCLLYMLGNVREQSQMSPKDFWEKVSQKGYVLDSGAIIMTKMVGDKNGLN
jgi:hypothetical protein